MNKTEYLHTKLAEECAEVAQRACKSMIFGTNEVQTGQEETNFGRLNQEYNDLIAVAEMLGLYEVDELIDAKKAKVEKYMEYSKKLGTLQEN